MALYSTQLLVENKTITYQVYKEGDRLFFRPSESETSGAPIFWVIKVGGEWKPVNIPNKLLSRQIEDDILKHSDEVERNNGRHQN
jgi:hypothetical protein